MGETMILNKLLDWLNRSLYVGNWDINTYRPPIEEDWSHYYNKRVVESKEALGTRYILHKSNHVKRLDGKRYGEPAPRVKLRKV
jgi:hypothetical protein